MKKTLLLIAAALMLLLAGCDNANTDSSTTNGDEDADKVTYPITKTETLTDGSSCTITVNETTASGVTTKYVTEVVTTDDAKHAFGVVRMTSDGSTFYYKYMVEIGSKTVAYTNKSYDKIAYTAGSTSVPVESSVCSSGKSTDAVWNTFKILSVANSDSVATLKRQITLKVTMIDSTYDSATELATINSTYNAEIKSAKSQYELGLITRTEYEARAAQYLQEKNDAIAALTAKMSYTFNVPETFFTYLQNYM